MVRIILFLSLVGLHAFLGLSAHYGVEVVAPVFAATVYMPLTPFAHLGLPVFGGHESGGWASPSWLGWGLLGLLWGSFWWGLAMLFTRRSRVKSPYSFK